jgi:hypothetical protein
MAATSASGQVTIGPTVVTSGGGRPPVGSPKSPTKCRTRAKPFAALQLHVRLI